MLAECLEAASHTGSSEGFRIEESKRQNEDTLRDGRLLDACGEVIMVNMFPLGWLLMIFFMVWRAFRFLASGSLPSEIELLWTKAHIERKVPKSFQVPTGTFGVYYKEAAAMYTYKVLHFLLQGSQDLTVKDLDVTILIRGLALA